jgi:hypothetical protein
VRDLLFLKGDYMEKGVLIVSLSFKGKILPLKTKMVRIFEKKSVI